MDNFVSPSHLNRAVGKANDSKVHAGAAGGERPQESYFREHNKYQPGDFPTAERIVDFAVNILKEFQLMERFFYRIPAWNGEFRNIGSGWEEYQNLVRFATFIEESRSFDAITLYDPSRNIRVLLPIGGGPSFYRLGNAADWVPLYNVDRMQPNFTQANLTLLQQDCQNARDKLDKTIARLAQSIIVPTAALNDMRMKVRRIFHINMVDPDPADVPSEALQFANLLAEFKKLRSSGFGQDPPFVFEPNHTGSFQAWVDGVDDPKVHISPNYFYMDRDTLVFVLIHERAHTVLRLPGHPGGIPGVPSDGVPLMTRDEAIKNVYCYEGLTAALQN
jgi:hypothetical protein